MAVFTSSQGFDCRTCSPTMKMVRGCEQDVPSFDVWGYRMTRCPIYEVDSVGLAWIQVFAEGKKGILPNAGGWLDQPMKYGSVINILDGLMEKVEKENQNG